MRVVITGGTGLIGSALAADLAKDGHEVIVLTRSPERANNLPNGVRAVKWDATSAKGWEREADGAGAIVNLAGENISGDGFLPSRWTPARKERILQSRLNAGKAVVEAIRGAAAKPRVLIQSSAVGYYGAQDENHQPPLDETAPAGNDFLANVCKQWEAVTDEVESMGVRRAIIRTGVVLTFKGGVLPLLSLPYQFFAGGPIGSGKQPIPWIHIDDEVKAIRFLIENETASGVYNLTAPNPLTNAELGKTIGKVMGRPHWLPAPGFAFKLGFGELGESLVLTGQRVIPARLQAEGFHFAFPDAESALRDLY
ncbi:MAG: TIGR01777 family oxidoreductase [bacterium]|nr:TIGR01777 family oxidoreductase [bacterium]